jgi:hypothetical protein
MKLDYHDLTEDQFERLAVAISSYLLGPGVQGFSKGPDGGKDGRFSGRGERFPSAAAPWHGKVVIQAKHTDLINRKFSDSDFDSDAPSSILSKEIEKAKRLREQGELDFYLLFANRRMAGVAEQKLRSRIAQSVGIDDSAVYLCGEECMDQYLTWEPDLVRRAGINPFDVQPAIDPSDLARVIRHFADGKELLSGPVSADIPPPEHRTPLKTKNRINGLSEEYAKRIERYIKEFEPVRAFLAAPENE